MIKYLSNRKDIMMMRGDTVVIKINSPQMCSDLTAAYFSCKKKKSDNNYVFQKSLGSGITKTSTSETGRVYTITISPSDTASITEDGDYYYDIQLEMDSYKRTPFFGTLSIVNDITKD